MEEKAKKAENAILLARNQVLHQNGNALCCSTHNFYAKQGLNKLTLKTEAEMTESNFAAKLFNINTELTVDKSNKVASFVESAVELRRQSEISVKMKSKKPLRNPYSLNDKFSFN